MKYLAMLLFGLIIFSCDAGLAEKSNTQEVINNKKPMSEAEAKMEDMRKEKLALEENMKIYEKFIGTWVDLDAHLGTNIVFEMQGNYLLVKSDLQDKSQAIKKCVLINGLVTVISKERDYFDIKENGEMGFYHRNGELISSLRKKG